MNVAAGPELAAAVTNAGGLGVIGGVGYTPKILRSQVRSPISLLHLTAGTFVYSTKYTRCQVSVSDILFLDPTD